MHGTCLIWSRDLMFSSQTAASARQAGWESATVSGLESMDVGDLERYVVIVDLTLPGLRIDETLLGLRDLQPPPERVIAVGPHVHEAKLAAANSAGCDVVITKGQASRDLVAMLQQWGASPAE